MNVRIVVADEREAAFFDASRPGAVLARGSLRNAVAGLKDSDLESDREGRRFGGAGQRHGVDGERSTERHEMTNFAREVARKIDEDRLARVFDKLFIVAGPRMLGLLRQELPQRCRDVVAGEIAKDLMRQDPQMIRDVVPREVFWE